MLVARTLGYLARLLVARNRPGDRAEARRALSEADEIAARLGMPRVGRPRRTSAREREFERAP